MSSTSCANNHPLMLEVRAHFTGLGLVSCHLACCPNSASPHASRVTMPHDRAPLCHTRMLLCSALMHSLTRPCALRERSRAHAPTHLQDVARYPCTLLRLLLSCSPTLVPQHTLAAAAQPVRQTFLAFMLATSTPMLPPRHEKAIIQATALSPPGLRWWQ